MPLVRLRVLPATHQWCPQPKRSHAVAVYDRAAHRSSRSYRQVEAGDNASVRFAVHARRIDPTLIRREPPMVNDSSRLAAMSRQMLAAERSSMAQATGIETPESSGLLLNVATAARSFSALRAALSAPYFVEGTTRVDTDLCMATSRDSKHVAMIADAY